MEKIVSIFVLIFFSMYIPPAYSKECKALTVYGDIAQIAIPALAGGISLYKKDYEGTSQLIEGILWTAGTTHVLKATVNEKRPHGGGNDSFPSGHTSAAAQGAAFLQFRYGLLYGIPAYMATALVGYSRVNSNYHYWHDVIAGAILATGIQFVITKLGISITSLIFTPYVSNSEVGIAFLAQY